jgi:hypothetical protein
VSRRRLVIVHQEDGPSIQGIKVGWNLWSSELRLRKASLLEAENASVELEGEVRIPRFRILFIQLIARSG